MRRMKRKRRRRRTKKKVVYKNTETNEQFKKQELDALLHSLHLIVVGRVLGLPNLISEW